MDKQDAPQLAGVHHLKLPVTGFFPALHPDGHEIRFCTHQCHTVLDPAVVTTINDPRESAGRREQLASRPGLKKEMT
jgi:hypothetical protein